MEEGKDEKRMKDERVRYITKEKERKIETETTKEKVLVDKGKRWLR